MQEEKNNLVESDIFYLGLFMTFLTAVMYFQYHDSYIVLQLLFLSGNSPGILVLVFLLELPLLHMSSINSNFSLNSATFFNIPNFNALMFFHIWEAPSTF